MEQIEIFHCVHVAVDIAFHIAKSVGCGARGFHGFQSSLRSNGALPTANVFANVTQLADVHTFSGGKINHHPNGAHIANHFIVMVAYLHIALRKVAIVVFNPCGERIRLIHFRVACHFHGHARKHPSLVAFNHFGIAHTPGIGMEGCHFYDTRHHQREWHLFFGITFGCGEKKFLSEFF